MTTTSTAATQLAGFLVDLRFIACLCAMALYALWAAFARPSLVGLGRLSLVVAFAATVVPYAMGEAPLQALPYADLLVFLLLAIFLLLEFLFQMSVLGLFVAGIGTLVTGLSYIQGLPAARVAPNPMVAYWWVLRDLAVTTGVAPLVLGLGTALVLRIMHGRRPSKLVHPNDLRDVTAMLARASVPCLMFGTYAAIVAVARAPVTTLGDWWSLAWLFALDGTAVAWWARAEGRRFNGPRVLLLVSLNVLTLTAYAAERLVVPALTGGPHIP